MKMKIPHNWDDLRKFSETKFVNSMFMWIFVVPVLAKVFERLEDKTFTFVFYGQEIPLTLSLPFSWVLFYFCALSLAFGNAILIWKCPKLIKEHLTFSSFKNDGKTIDALEQYSKDVKYPWIVESVKIQSEVEKKKTLSAFDHTYTGEQTRNIDSADPVHYFWPVFHVSNESKVWSRRICAFLFFLGALLFFGVLVQNLISVIELLRS